MEYVQMTLTDWMNMKGQLELELRNASASFVRIGYLLRRIDESEGYRNEGFETLAEWAQSTYGLSKPTVSRFMAINAKYSIDGYSEQLLPEFAMYGSSKLAEMLALPDEDMAMVSPEMKRDDIRAIKQFNEDAAKEAPADAKSPSKQVSEPAENEKEETDPRQGDTKEPEAKKNIVNAPAGPEWVWEFFKQHRETANELWTSEAWKNTNVEQMREIVNPSGAATFRHKMTMVSMMNDKLMVKVFPGAPQKMDWSEFFSIVHEMFDALIEGKEPYEAVYGKAKPAEQEPVRKKEEPKQEKPADNPEPDTVAPAQHKEEKAEDYMPLPEKEAPAESADESTGKLREIKDRFREEMKTLVVYLDGEYFTAMQPILERMEKLRERMQDIKDEQAIETTAEEKGEQA